MEKSRRNFLKTTAIAAAGSYVGTFGMSARSYANIMGANDRIRVVLL